MRITTILIYLILLSGCGKKSEGESGTKEDSVSQSVSVPLQREIAKDTDTSEFECVRGEPTPALDSLIFPNRNFRIIDRISARETVGLDNGDSVIVTHWGCEYYVLTYRFETSRFQGDTLDVPFWYKKTVMLLSEIEPSNTSVMHIREGIDAMINYIDDYADKRFDEKIVISPGEISEIISLDKIEKIGSKRFAIEVTFAIGPL